MAGRGLVAGIVAICALTTEVRAEIAYSALEDGRWRVYVQNAPGAAPDQISSGITVDAGGVALAPDRKKVAFETTDGRVLVCGVEKKARCEALAEKDAQLGRPAWFPAGDDLVLVKFQARPTGEDSELVLREKRDLRPLLTQTGVQDDPDVHPARKMVAYSSAQTVSLRRAGVQLVQHLWLVDLGTGHARPLIPSDARDTQPDWSPSGEQLAFSSNRSGQFEIWVVDAEGKNLRMVTPGEGAKTAPAWSPDGKAIMFTMAREGRYGLWIVDVDGTNLRQFQPFGPDSKIEVRDADWR